MRTGKELILATKPFAKEIRWKSWFHTITGFILLIACVSGTMMIPYLLIRILCSLGAALMLSRVFIIFHDFQHHTILHKSPAANILFTIFGFYMITPPSIWKRSHDHHHNHNAKLFSASIGSYPIMTKQKFLESSRKKQMMYLTIRHPLNMFFAYFTTFLYGMCIRSFLSSPRRHWDSLFVLVVHVALAVLVFIKLGWLIWFLGFFLPFFISHMLGAYLFYAQHNFPGAVFRTNSEWNYAQAALESSSYMKMGRFGRWITANIGYHHVHHLNSRIPFYRLPETMNNIPELQHARVTRLTPGEILRCLKLKVWDPEKNKLVGLSEI